MDDYRAQARRRWEDRGTAGKAGDSAAPTKTHAPLAGSRSAGVSSEKRDGNRTAPDSAGGAQVPPLSTHVFLEWWESLTADQRSQILLGGSFLLVFFALGAKIVPILLLALTAMYLHERLPTAASFEPHFQEWFTAEYFPKVSQKLTRELQERAKKETFLTSLATQFKGWVIGKTEGLQAAAWYELHVRHWCLPPRFGDFYFMKTACVNLGSRARPCIVTFWGLNGWWMLSPFLHIDFENVSLLDEIDKQKEAAASGAGSSASGPAS
eukprot:TRINITY_DN38400_c0_g1_i2.p1 TRINITY_DN38400_c0_g1~~TRINITY_DN38400_c0_g1_i2.p1  ORF type:complete len:267 (-),score=52.14 TRINITY_DN38400_c0_g1_i2:89-889(-)